jgi:hypothetical protein
VTSAPVHEVRYHDWHRYSAEFCIVPKTKPVQLNLTRQSSLKFDSLIKGTIWLDSVKLSKLSPNCVN